MKETKLVALISIVHHQNRVTALHKYLQRQYFKSDGLEFILWEHIRRIVKKGNLNHNRLERKYIQKELFNDDLKSLNRTSSRLYLRIKNFTIEQFLDDNSIIQDWLFRESIKTEYISENRLKSLVTDSLLNSDIKPKNRIEDAFQYFMRFHLNYELYQEKNLENTIDIDLFNKVRHLFNEYFIRYYEDLEIEKEQLRQSYIDKIVDLIGLNVEKTPNNRIDLLLKKAKQLELYPSYFEFCKNEFIDLVNDCKITRERQLVIFPLILNFANRQSIKGNKQYLLSNIEYFLYLGFDKHILYTNNRLPIFIYTNFLSLVSSSRDIKPIEQYAAKYVKDVEEKDLNMAHYFTEIFIAFYKKDYQQVVDIIHINERNVKIGFSLNLRIRIWRFLICSFFELKHEDALMNALQSFRRYIKGQTIPENKKDIDFRFIAYTRKIYKCTTLLTLQKIEKALNKEDNLIYRNWLEDKIKESYSKFS